MQSENPIQPVAPSPSQGGQPSAVPTPAGQTVPAEQVKTWIDQLPEGGRTLEPPKSRLVLKITVASIGALLVVGGIVTYMLLKPSDGSGLNLLIAAPETIVRGMPIAILVQVENNSDAPLKDAHVTLTLPEDIIFVGVPGKRNVENRTVGALEIGRVHRETFTVMAVGAENTVHQLQASISYIPGVLSSRFEKVTSKDIILGGAGIDLSVSVPTKALSNEEFAITLTYRNNTEVVFEDFQLGVKYPQGFAFRSANPKTVDEEANVLWNFGMFKPGDVATTTIKGVLLGQDNAVFEFNAALSALIGEARYDVAQGSASVTLSPSPLSVKISLEGGDQQFVGPGTGLRYRLTYTNNTDIALKDVIIRARAIGEMFDLKTLKTEGVLRSSDNTIVWNASRVPELTAVTPGATGVVSFTISTKPAYLITRLSSKNFILTIRAEAESPTVPRGVNSEKTLGISELVNKMRGALNLSTLGYYRDAPAGIVNSGVLPPTVSQPTQFTIHWVLKNTSTDVSKISMKAFLGPNVRYTGKYKSTTETGPAYNDRTQEITWGVASMQATKGILSQPTELVFQVELTPAIDQVDSYPVLIGETTGTYTDLFTGEEQQIKDDAVTVNLSDDLTTVGVDKRVKQ